MEDEINVTEYLKGFISVGHLGEKASYHSVLWFSLWVGVYGLNIDVRPRFEISLVDLRTYM
jgi:hypothetical protein